jgi:thymidylate synthase ThyX
MLKRELPGSKLFLIDDVAPEDLAMLQALYSRSAESVEVHLEKVHKTGSAKFCQQYFVNYNHKSIADCGSTTFFIEGVSTLAAKAIQDWPLYSGQETSTRFIDMSKQRIEDPVGSSLSGEVLNAWMTFYKVNSDRVCDEIRKRYPRRESEKEDAYEKAVKARSFDILRGWLPAGITTQLSWHTNLRQAGDHLTLLSKHPAAEIRNIAVALQAMFAFTYSSSNSLGQAGVSAVTGNEEARQQREEWNRTMVEAYTYPASIEFHRFSFAKEDTIHFRTTINPYELAHYRHLRGRPRGCVVPHFLTDLGQISFAFLLDFGSFRDIQRHRNGVVRMPLLTTEWGFEPWYLKQLDAELAMEALTLIKRLSPMISNLTDDPVARQNYVALGYRVPNQVTWGLPAALYVMELRSSKTVHPSLRRATLGMVGKFRETFPDVTIHADTDPDDWTVRRGGQTIVAKT